MHGAYLVSELLSKYRGGKRQDSDLLRSAIRVAQASIARMDTIGDTLRFYYSPNTGISSFNFRFFSALTQSRYLQAFVLLHKELGEEWILDAARRIAASFDVSVDEGGVKHVSARGVVFEEYPTVIPTYVLNGWMTTLIAIFYYAVYANDKSARRLATGSTRTLARLLPMYDVPELLNSRYKLSGSILSVLTTSSDMPFTLKRLSIITDNAEFEPDLAAETTGYDALYLVQSGSGNRQQSAARQLKFRTSVSMAHYPEDSFVEVDIDSPEDAELSWGFGLPRADPRFVTPRIVGQRVVAKHRLAKGLNRIRQKIPLDLVVAWAGAPIPFSKKINGKYHNVYHYLQIRALTQLYEYLPLPRLIHYRDKWLSYTKQWPSFATYQPADIAHGPIYFGQFNDSDTYLKTPDQKVVDGKLVDITINSDFSPAEPIDEDKNDQWAPRSEDNETGLYSPLG